jgi:uncharacterized protein YdeI (YjbR/CyaY-like superfamily)
MMPAPLDKLEVCDRRHWRTWLEKHHASSPGVWLVFLKTGTKSLDYEDAVREALCFGWIDSIIRRIDDRQYVRKFTPRRPSSKWSDINRKRWAELEREGLLAAAGMRAPPTGRSYAPRPAIPDLPEYIAEAFQAHPKAWTFFQSLPRTERRWFVAWIHTAKREETRARRIAESIALLEAGKKLGLK